MTDNKDIAVLAKKIYELSILPVAALEARKWEALLMLNCRRPSRAHLVIRSEETP